MQGSPSQLLAFFPEGQVACRAWEIEIKALHSPGAEQKPRRKGLGHDFRLFVSLQQARGALTHESSERTSVSPVY